LTGCNTLAVLEITFLILIIFFNLMSSIGIGADDGLDFLQIWTSKTWNSELDLEFGFGFGFGNTHVDTSNVTFYI